MTNPDFDALVIGAGVIGLAVARQLTAAGKSVLLVERNDQFGMGASSRNTGCIHAGAYYHAGSLKGALCVRGRNLLYAHCARHDVPHRRTGKIFVATSDDFVPGLETIKKLAKANGLGDLTEIEGKDIGNLEPHLKGAAALLCPESGVVDVHAFMFSLLGLAENDGLTFVPRTRVNGAQATDGGWRVNASGSEDAIVTARMVVNAAGIQAPALSRSVFPDRAVPSAKPVKGSYLRLPGASPISRIIYPDLVPGQITERVDATPGIDGELRFGPTVDETASCEDFQVADGLVDRLGPLIRRYLPAVDTARLVPDYAGVRPKVATPPDQMPDFIFDWAEEPGWLDLWGMESPGLTSALAIAEHVESLLTDAGLV